jgi:hypothetical protein
MTKHLGRNPFNRKNDLPSATTKKADPSTPAEWNFIKIPVKSYHFTLETAKKVKDTIGKISSRIKK